MEDNTVKLFKDHATTYLEDAVKQGENQKVIDSLENLCTDIKRRIDSYSEKKGKAKVKFAEAISQVKTNVDIDSTLSYLLDGGNYDKEIEGLKLMLELVEAAKKRATSTAEETPEMKLASAIKELSNK